VATIQAFIGDAEYPLRLRIAELRILQTALDSGPSRILTRLQSGDWLVDDVIETIRLALIGGGMGHQDAAQLVRSYVCEGHLLTYSVPAMHVLIAALIGDVEDQPEEDDDDLGEPKAPTTPGA